MRDVDETRKQHLIDQLDDIEYSDIEHLPVEDVAAIVERRHEQSLRARRDLQAAMKALDAALESFPEEERQSAVRGLDRLLDDTDTTSIFDGSC